MKTAFLSATWLMLVCGGLLFAQGCASRQSAIPSSPPEAVAPGSASQGSSPYGVYDIQSGHGHGQWRQSTEPLAR